jgi:hypothetical protein
MTLNTRAVALAVLVVLTAAAVYEAAVALRWLSIGDEPSDGPPREGFVFAAALFALTGLGH